MRLKITKTNSDTNYYVIKDINKNESSIELYKDKVSFKERWIKENDLEQKLIVTYSLKYRNYQRQIHNSQIERAKVAITNKSFKLEKCNQNDFKKFIKKTNITNDGEIAEKKVLTLIAYLLVFHFLLHILFYFFHLLWICLNILFFLLYSVISCH